MIEKNLPKGWRLIKLRDAVTKVGSGVTPKGGKDSYLTSGIPLIRSQNVLDGTLDITEVAFISEKQHKQMGSSAVQAGDVLLNITGASIGRSCIVPDNIGEANVNQHVCIIRPTSAISPKYLNLVLGSSYGKQLIDSYQAGGGRQGLNFEQIKAFPIPAPPSDEQNRISDNINTWDEAIYLQTRKLQQLRKRRNGVAQELLRGNKRLSIFAKKSWGTCPISAVAKQVSIRNQGGAKLRVLSCTKYKGLVDSLEYFGRQMYSDDLSSYKVVPRNTFAYATNHIEEGSIGYQRDYESALISPMYTVFRTDSVKMDDDFMFHLLKSETYIEIYRRNMSGSISRRGGLRWDDFSRIKIPDIGKDEQRAIAEVLNTADAEIRLEEQKLTALREQKRGLLHQLLTGQLRLS